LYYSEEYFPNDGEKKEDTPIDLCKHEWILMEAYPSCRLCGIFDIDKPIFVPEKPTNPKHHILFQRKTYFLTILKLLSCGMPCDRSDYPTILEQISENDFEDIFELKKIMSKLKLRKFYKYIYLIYFDIKKIKLINLKYYDIEFLSNKFLLLERHFKEKYPNKSNMLSYSLIAYCLLKRYNYDSYKYVIIPKKKDLLLEKLNDLLKNIDN